MATIPEPWRLHPRSFEAIQLVETALFSQVVDDMLTGIPVLIVDPDASSAKLLAVVLRGAGCDARLVDSGEAAVLALGDFRPRAMISELVLPLMSGVLLAQRLRANPAHADIVLIAVSSVNGRETDRVARAAGFAAYVRKPIDAVTFPDLLAVHLGASR